MYECRPQRRALPLRGHVRPERCRAHCGGHPAAALSGADKRCTALEALYTHRGKGAREEDDRDLSIKRDKVSYYCYTF